LGRFKLHLRPRALSAHHIRDEDIPKLPPGKSAVDVLADYLNYLYRCTEEYIKAQPAGPELWNSFGQQIDFVLSHPNGWEGAQQSQMRRAAVLARLIPDGPRYEHRIQFVTEGEASLHFCAQNKSTMDAIKVIRIFHHLHHHSDKGIQEDKGLIILDAGGGTIDSSAYFTNNVKDSSFEEIAVPECEMFCQSLSDRY
jgi:hypothetical protein